MKHDERRLQVACVRWFSLEYPEYAIYLHHSPNGGSRNKIEAANFKTMGVRAGFPDLVLLLPRGGHPFLAVEMKAQGGRLSTNQRTYLAALETVGARCEVVRSFEQFMDIIKSYLHGE